MKTFKDYAKEQYNFHFYECSDDKWQHSLRSFVMYNVGPTAVLSHMCGDSRTFKWCHTHASLRHARFETWFNNHANPMFDNMMDIVSDTKGPITNFMMTLKNMTQYECDNSNSDEIFKLFEER